VITNVSRDHTHVLGSTVHQIAYEKAGIIKPGVPVISGVTHADALSMIEQTSRDRGATLKLIGREFSLVDRQIDRHGLVEIKVKTETSNWTGMPVILKGPHQALNATLALAVVDELRKLKWSISDDAVRSGLSNVIWPGRVEVISRRPTVVIDAAHNWESARALVDSLAEERSPRKRILVFAATKDKDVAGILRQLLPNFDTLILTRYVDNPRGVSLEELSSLVEAMTVRPAHLVSEPIAAWRLAKRLATADDLIVVTGSFFLVAELQSAIANERNSAIS
jgi:dihydrofolate synthase/folylpolyglutamate synthase